MKGLDWYKARIPAEVVGNGLLDDFFTISDPTTPCDISESTDCRKLDISAEQLQIKIIDG
jgi:hypothetical protein